MTKKQKVWLWVFLIMFIIPELLWSPVSNIVYGLIQNSNHVKNLRTNFLTNPDNINIFLIVIFVQLIGSLFGFLLTTKSHVNLWLKILLIIITLFILLTTGLVFFISFSLRHGIGF